MRAGAARPPGAARRARRTLDGAAQRAPPMCRTYFKLKSFFAMEEVSDAAWQTMIEWEAKIDK